MQVEIRILRIIKTAMEDLNNSINDLLKDSENFDFTRHRFEDDDWTNKYFSPLTVSLIKSIGVVEEIKSTMKLHDNGAGDFKPLKNNE